MKRFSFYNPVMGNISVPCINKQVSSCFHFNEGRILIDKNYISNLSPFGRWDAINIKFENIPQFIAKMLLYKRHIWNVFVLADKTDPLVARLYAHKGYDNRNVSVPIELMDEVDKLTIKEDYDTVFMFRNQPRIRDMHGNLLEASKDDLKCFEALQHRLGRKNTSIIAGIVAQGDYNLYAHNIKERKYKLLLPSDECRQSRQASA